MPLWCMIKIYNKIYTSMEYSFLQNSKKLFWECFWVSSQNDIFFQKSGSISFLPLRRPNFMRSFRKILWTMSEKMCLPTDILTYWHKIPSCLKAGVQQMISHYRRAITVITAAQFQITKMNSGSTLIQIMLAVCWRFAMVTTSDKCSNWKYTEQFSSVSFSAKKIYQETTTKMLLKFCFFFRWLFLIILTLLLNHKNDFAIILLYCRRNSILVVCSPKIWRLKISETLHTPLTKCNKNASLLQKKKFFFIIFISHFQKWIQFDTS